MESPDSSPTVRPSWPQKRDFAVLLTCPLLGPPTAAWSFTALAVLESAARSPDALAAFWRQIRVPDLFFIAVVSYGPMLPAALLGAATSSIAGLRIRSRLALLCLGPLFGAAAAALCLAALTLVAPDFLWDRQGHIVPLGVLALGAAALSGLVCGAVADGRAALREALH